MGRRSKHGATPRTIAVIVQDKSGSMHTKTDATISGFNEYKNTLRRDAKGDVLLTLTQFDTRVQRVHSAAAIHDVPDLNHDSYVAGGMTALYDAVGRAVRDTEKVARKSDRVLVVIMTDGGENSSREWTHVGILDLLETKRRDDWEFVFLGAGEEAWSTGQSLGFVYANSINYNATPAATADSYQALATSTLDYSKGQSMARSMTSNTIKQRLESDAGRGMPNTTTGGITTAGDGTNLNILWSPSVTTATTGTTSATPVSITPVIPPEEEKADN